ncbi:MAG: M20/M25/M40 family metallo-hydrolase [Coriobacteriia bacterium]|nr:M20/M25/M40 family metallo-hydrolase [Coriobacteriia bacterium]MCL2750199.1 M20/M25/M40 family metallo-hydrolase [Coriobacteriia bacterium]
MATINPERLLATFLDLVQIDSPTGQEAELAAYCKQVLEEAGCTINLEALTEVPNGNSGNVVATLPAFSGVVQRDGVAVPQQPRPSVPLYFSAHMDVVEPCRGIKPQIKDGVIYSDGTTVLGGDDKAGLAAIIEMIRCLVEAEAKGEAHPEIGILFTAQEEVGLQGAKALGKEAFRDAQGALCYVLDAAGKPGLVVNGAPFHYSYRAEFKGVAAHAGIAPEKGVSAIKAAAQAVQALPQGRLDEESTTNVGFIKGGTAGNVVAAACLVTGELRSQSKDKLLAHQARIEEILKSSPVEDDTRAGAVEVTVEWKANYEGFFAPEDSPQVELAMRAARKLGLEARTEISNGGADTNVFSSFGLAAVSLGCGMDYVHSTEERLVIKDLENLARWALAIVRESFG